MVAFGGAADNVTNVSEVLAAADKSRHRVTIQNRSTTAMLTVSLGKAAVTKVGYNLAPAADATHPGGSVTIEDYKGAIYGIMSGADATAANVSIIVE